MDYVSRAITIPPVNVTPIFTRSVPSPLARFHGAIFGLKFYFFFFFFSENEDLHYLTVGNHRTIIVRGTQIRVGLHFRRYSD